MQKMELVAKNIKTTREDVKWSQIELAKRAGITPAAVSLIESGHRSPSLNVALKISEAFNIPISELTEQTNKDTDNQGTFYRQYSDINTLDSADQQIIANLIQHLKGKTMATD